MACARPYAGRASPSLGTPGERRCGSPPARTGGQHAPRMRATASSPSTAALSISAERVRVEGERSQCLEVRGQQLHRPQGGDQMSQYVLNVIEPTGGALPPPKTQPNLPGRLPPPNQKR